MTFGIIKDVEKRSCFVCGSEEKIVQHHVSYFPEKTIPVCLNCHTKIHGDMNFMPELTPPIGDSLTYYGKKEPLTPMKLDLIIINGIKIEFLEIQQKLGLSDNSETIRFIIHQMYRQLHFDKMWWD